MVLSFNRKRPTRGKFTPCVGGQAQPVLNSLTSPAPIQGVNLFDSLADMSPRDAVYAYNIGPAEYGFRTRRGYQEHCTDMGSAGNAVRTLIPFEGESSSDDKLFAATVLGLYDVTASADNPAIDTSFGTQSGNAGYGVYEAYNNDNGDHFLFYADEVNGLYEYDGGAGTWAVSADITGVSESNLVFVTEHKDRLWFVERDTADAWYLAVGTKGGAATKFSLGNKFKRGGHLKGIFKWAVDGGDGPDDLLVFVSSAGEVAIYQGTDVSAATSWSSVGTWFIGQTPDSRRICENIGGEMHIISTMGLISLSDLVRGLSIQQLTGQQSLSKRITRAIRNDMVNDNDDFTWDIVPIPSEGSVLVLRPYSIDANAIQYVFSFSYPGWTYWRGLPMQCCVEWKGTVYFGDGSGNVHKMINSLDGVVRAGTGGSPVKFSFLTAYSDLDAPGIVVINDNDDFTWDIVPIPSEGSVLVLRPYSIDANAIQYVFSFSYPGWTYWRGLPMQCCVEWKGTVYFGDGSGNVHKMINSLDGVVRAGTGGSPVKFSFLTAYSDLDAPGITKQVHLVRPRFFSENGDPPAFNAQVCYDYQIAEKHLYIPASTSVTAGVWDTGLWDDAVWGGDATPDSRLIGTSGMGQVVALAIKGECKDRTTYLDSSLYGKAGGLLF